MAAEVQTENPWTTPPPGGYPETKDYAELGHKLTDKKLRDWLTNLSNAEGYSTIDVVVSGLIKDEFAGTGFEKDFDEWRKVNRDNRMAVDGWRAKQIENVSAAAANREAERRSFVDRVLGHLER